MIKNLYKNIYLIIILLLPLISVAKTLIVCEGTEKVWASIFGNAEGSKNIVETWSIENNKLNGLNDCPVAGSHLILCYLNIAGGVIPDVVKLTVSYELDRVSGFFRKRQEQVTTMESEFKNNPFLRNLAGSEATFKRVSTAEGYCKKGGNKF
jgi:hypothetical protein